MKNVIGNPARAESFFPRDEEVDKIVSKLDDGNNLNIAAPRRIGKTSILYSLMDQGRGGFTYTFVDTEDVESEPEFFRRVQKELSRTEAIRNSKRLRGLMESGHRFLGKVKGLKIMGQGIEFADDAMVENPKEDLINFLSGVELENSKGLVILLDEFPQTVQNIIDISGEDPSPVRKFLQANREMRLNPEINKKVRFVLTGSIGLIHTVSKIGMTAFINDLNSVEIGPLKDKDAVFFLDELLRPKCIAVPEGTKQYILRKIGWLIPFHIQLLVQEILSLCEPMSSIDNTLVDRAFEAILQRRNDNHFNHYYSRLKRQFKDQEFAFSNNLLDVLAKKGTLRKSEVFDLAVKYDLLGQWKGILDTLFYDGYIVSSSDSEIKFNSPVVGMWWQRFICN